MLGDGFGSSAGFEDFRKNDLPPAMSMLRTMRKRFYGIILMEKPADVEPEIVEEWSVEGNSNIKKPFTVWPILPTGKLCCDLFPVASNKKSPKFWRF